MRVDYEYVTDDREVDLIIMDALNQDVISVDCENNGGLDPLLPGVNLLLLQIGIGRKAYLLDMRKIKDASKLNSLFLAPHIQKIVQNGKYDYKLLYCTKNLTIKNMYDTMLAEFLLVVGLGARGKLNLGALTQKYHGFEIDKSLGAEFSDHPTEAEFSEEQLKYAALDVILLPTIRDKQLVRLEALDLMPTAQLEFDTIVPTAMMELNGMKLDVEKWRIGLEDAKKKLFKVEGEIRKYLPDPPPPPPITPRYKKDGVTMYEVDRKRLENPPPPPVLNLGSPVQLADALRKVNIDIDAANRKTQAGLTRSLTLKYASTLYSDYRKDILKNILEFRGHRQIINAFGDNLIEQVREDGRIYSNFNQDGTVAGRYSSNNPNLEQMPKKGEEGKILRSCFVPPVGSKFIIADFGALHVRIAASLSNDPVLIEILQDPDADIHKSTASILFGVPVSEVTREMRGIAKTILFGIFYGMGIGKMADSLEMKKEEASELYYRFKERFEVVKWLQDKGIEAAARGFATTCLGRRRNFPRLDQTNFDEYKKQKAYQERAGGNHVILGTDGDILKQTIVLLTERMPNEAKLCNVIHDEVVVEAPESIAVHIAGMVKQCMIEAAEKFIEKVPVIVDVKIRDMWWHESGDQEDNEHRQQLTMFDVEDYKGEMEKWVHQ